MNNNTIKLPLFETVIRSFMYVIKNFQTLIKTASIFIVLWIGEIFTGLPDMCAINNGYCQEGIKSNILSALLYLSMAVVATNTIRSIILKQNFKWFHLEIGKYTLRYIAYKVLVALMIIIPTAMILMISGNNPGNNFLHGVSFATFLGLFIFCFRLYLVFAASAIDDKEMTLAKSYALTSGNMLKIFCGQILLIIPTTLITFALSGIYMLSTWGYVSDCIFVLLGMICAYFDMMVKASYYSHLYQFFIYSSKHQKN